MKYDYLTDVKTETLKTGRTYYTPDGAYPSITTILGKTADNTWLQKWIERVGEEEAARVSKEATDRGTLVHEYAERHFNDEDISDLALQTLDVRQMSHDLIKMAESGIEEVWGQEQVLWSNKYRYAGRTDMVGIWKGKPTIIDFKTSKKKNMLNRLQIILFSVVLTLLLTTSCTVQVSETWRCSLQSMVENHKSLKKMPCLIFHF